MTPVFASDVVPSRRRPLRLRLDEGMLALVTKRSNPLLVSVGCECAQACGHSLMSSGLRHFFTSGQWGFMHQRHKQALLHA